MFTPVKGNNNRVYADPFAHIIEQVFGDATRGRTVGAGLATQFEIAETNNEYTIAAELPGLETENVDVIVDEDVLTVRGEKKVETKAEEKNYLFSERRYGTFERKFQLPEAVKQDAIAASYENGVLTLTLPKKPEAIKPEPRQIKIKS
jgi:HSP20 family protein